MKKEIYEAPLSSVYDLHYEGDLLRVSNGEDLNNRLYGTRDGEDASSFWGE